jgi:hypothetical protein
VDIAPSRDWHTVYAAGHVHAYCPDAASHGSGIVRGRGGGRCRLAGSRHGGRYRRVNEGTLAFITVIPPGRRVLQTRNRMTIGAESLASGWVALAQCQGKPDPVAAVEIVYRYHGLRKLRVLSAAAVRRTRGGQRTGMYK